MKPRDLQTIVIQYKLKGYGSTKDLDRRYEIEDLMNERLKSNGLGYCDGADMGSGEMNIFCLVTDTAIAEKIIVNSLKEHSHLEDAVVAQRDENEYKVLWPKNFSGNFKIQ